MLKIVVNEELVEEIELRGDVLHFTAELLLAVGAIYSQLHSREPAVAELFRAFLTHGIADAASPAFQLRPQSGLSIFLTEPEKQ